MRKYGRGSALVLLAVLMPVCGAFAAAKTTAECLANTPECSALMETILMVSSSTCMPDDPPAKRHAAVITWLKTHKAQSDAVLAINDAAHALWPCKTGN